MKKSTFVPNGNQNLGQAIPTKPAMDPTGDWDAPPSGLAWCSVKKVPPVAPGWPSLDEV